MIGGVEPILREAGGVCRIWIWVRGFLVNNG
jgi:hypothetical protein